MEAHTPQAENTDVCRVDIRLFVRGKRFAAFCGSAVLSGGKVGLFCLCGCGGLFLFGQRLLVFAHKRLHPLLQGY